MTATRFETFFAGKGGDYLVQAIDLALDEDGKDLTSFSLFSPMDIMSARIVAKQECVAAGLPILPLVLDRCGPGACEIELLAEDGAKLRSGNVVAVMHGPAAIVLKAERVMLNFLTHLSGIATLTARYVAALEGTRTRLLDTRKTLPGLRYPEKYAVLMGGGVNHRLGLEDMLMLKDNHIDHAGSISEAVSAVRGALPNCPPVEVECRNEDEVREAVAASADRIMLDNMDVDALKSALALIPNHIESEVSGNVDLDNIGRIGEAGPDFVSVGRITHSAPSADFSMQVLPEMETPF